MKRRREQIREVPRDTLVRLANIFGFGSASERALAELDERLSAGEDAVCYSGHGMYFVGPRLPPDPRMTPETERTVAITA